VAAPAKKGFTPTLSLVPATQGSRERGERTGSWGLGMCLTPAAACTNPEDSWIKKPMCS